MDAFSGRVVVLYRSREQSADAVCWAAREAVRRRVPLTVLHVVGTDRMASGQGRAGMLRWWPEVRPGS